MQAMVVPAVVEHDRRAVARNRRVENRETPDRIAMLGCECKGAWAAPVVTDDEQALLAENVMGEPPDVVGHRLLVVRNRRPAARCKPGAQGPSPASRRRGAMRHPLPARRRGEAGSAPPAWREPLLTESCATSRSFLEGLDPTAAPVKNKRRCLRREQAR